MRAVFKNTSLAGRKQRIEVLLLLHLDVLKNYYAYRLFGLLIMLRYSIRITCDVLSPETISLLVTWLFLKLSSSISFLSLLSSCSIAVAFHFYQSSQDNTRRKLSKDNVYELVLVIHWMEVFSVLL